jgi:hypothetical protein
MATDEKQLPTHRPAKTAPGLQRIYSLLSAVGAPTVFVGMLLPLRQAGTLLPQLAVAGRIRQYPLRKWFWVAAAMVQAISLLGMVAAALTLII